jgi:hypothetical protein
VSHTFVQNLRSSLETVSSDNDSDNVKYTDRWGKEREMNTTNIGRRREPDTFDEEDDFPEVPGEVVNLDTGEVLAASALRELPPAQAPPDDRAARAAQAIVEKYGNELARRIGFEILGRTGGRT